MTFHFFNDTLKIYSLEVSHLKIKCYNYMIFFVSLTVTTKEKASVDTQTIIIKESKPTVIVIKSQ